jgi:hypothetical protein
LIKMTKIFIQNFKEYFIINRGFFYVQEVLWLGVVYYVLYSSCVF